MKSIIVIPVFLISIFSYCIGQRQSTSFINFSDTSRTISKSKFNSSLVGFDTANAKLAIALHKVASCSWGTYKFINAKYVIRINTELFSKRLDNFYEINIAAGEINKFVELLVYDKSDATLENICTDIGDMNNPHPTRRIKALKGKIIVGFTKPYNSYDQFDVTVLIQSLTFINPTTKEVVTFKNELIWKVFYDGIPG